MAALTPLKKAQRSGSCQIGTPASCARSRRKASVEFASVKKAKTAMTFQNCAGRRLRGPAIAGAGSIRRTVSGTASQRTTIAATPGTAARRNTVLSSARASLRSAVASSGPTSAPALSMAR